MTIIDPAKGWFKIVEIIMINLDEVTAGNNEYTDKLSARVCQMFNNTCLCRYPRPCKVIFDNGHGFKQDFTPLLKYFYIKHVLKTIKKQQANALMERVHQVILNMLAAKYLDNKVFYHIGPWG